jgi:acetyl esterase/lipase
MDFSFEVHSFFLQLLVLILGAKINLMQLKITILLFVLCITVSLSAQNRYKAELLDEINIETVTYATKDGINLDMDIYSSLQDTATNKPAVLFVHGGGFFAGSRDHEKIQEFCKHLARYGYVVSSMSYRLTRANKPEAFGCNCATKDKEYAVEAAKEDVQDATFFLIENREQYGINPHEIILAGSSAGAETVLNTAYQPANCYGLESGPVAYAGVISMAGAISDTTLLYEDSAIPSLFFHGTNDKLVPYGTAPHHYCKEGAKGYWILHGPYTITQKLDKLGTSYWFQTVCGGGHEVSSTPLSDYFDVIVEFCSDFVLNHHKEQRRTFIKTEQVTEDQSAYHFCDD